MNKMINLKKIWIKNLLLFNIICKKVRLILTKEIIFINNQIKNLNHQLIIV